MTAAATSTTAIITLADLLEQLGNIAPARVRFRPVPGTATKKDVLAIHDREDRLYELVDGVLVEKVIGFRESLLAGMLIEILRGFVRVRNLGLVTAPDGMMRLTAGLVRIPDVAPNLAVEVLSTGNTPGEMARKRQDYFAAGAQVVWQVDSHARTVQVFTAPEQSTVLHETQPLEGGTVLPGFTLPLQELFSELDRQGEN